MILNGEAKFPGNLFLQCLDLTVFKLDDLPAVGADHVIVVPLAGGMLEQGTALAELALVGKASLLQQFQGPIDGDEPDPAVAAADSAVQGLGANVGVGGEEGPGDQLALAGGLQPGPNQVLPELLLLLLHSH
jgi:hypothetical protein